MRKPPCCDPTGLKRGAWTPEEDQKLFSYIQLHGHGSWRSLPQKAGLQRCGKSCRLRWTNYLRPDIKRGGFSLQEDRTIIQLHALLGNRWSTIASHLPSRTDNEIKNYWNTHLKKRLTQMGIDPATHKPASAAVHGGSKFATAAATISHLTQWETARLEAEARLVRDSKRRRIQPSPPLKPLPYILPQSLPLKPAPCLDVLKASQGIWTKPALSTGAAAGAGSDEVGGVNISGLGILSNAAIGFPETTGFSAVGGGGFRAHRQEAAADGGEVLKMAGGDVVDKEGILIDGFVNLLGDQSFSESVWNSETCGGSSCEENNKSYWNELLGLIDGGAPPTLVI